MNTSKVPPFSSSGAHRLCADFCDMQQLIESCSRSYEQQLAPRGMVLCTRIRGPIPRFVRADAEVIDRLFDCLGRCTSAVEARGCAVLDIAAEPEGEDRHNIYLVLTLSGNGLDARQEEQLLAAQEGTDDESASALQQARAICRRYDGNILIRNSSGFGTRFLVKLCLTVTPGGETVDHA